MNAQKERGIDSENFWRKNHWIGSGGWKDRDVGIFGAIFLDFSEARDLFVNIFKFSGTNCKITDCGLISEKTEGPKCKICKSGPWVDFKETQGLLCKMAGNSGWAFIFQRIKQWTGPRIRGPTGRAHSTVDRRRRR
jgi:hypothetical protein